MIATYDNLSYLTDDEGFIQSINQGRSEPYPRELGIVKRYLEMYPTCNNICIDIGGHIGTTSLPYSRLFNKVFAFEPNKKSYDFFIENIKINNIDNVTVYNKGVYNKNTNCNVIKHGENSGCFYITECNNNEPNAVEVIKLDDITDNNSNVDFLKIDTEGSELQILEGALNIITTFKPLIQVETNCCSMKYFGYAKDKIYDFMRQNNYKIFAADESNPLFYNK